MTQISRRNLLLQLAMILPAAYAAPQVLVGKAHAASPSVGPTRDEQTCNAARGFSRHIYPAEIAGIDSRYTVSINRICEGDALMRSDGNGSGLRAAISANPFLVSSLSERGASPADVFAVRIIKSKIIFDIHTFAEY